MWRWCLLLVMVAGCGVEIPEGRFACESDGDCPADFRCFAQRCYSDPSLVTNDAGTADGTVAGDASASVDGSTPADARLGLDASTGVDASTGIDATVGSDAGAGEDAAIGVDAAASDATVTDAGQDAGDAGDAAVMNGPCASNPCFPDVECTEVGSDYQCGDCPPGYDGDGTTCEDFDACTGAPCFDGVACTDLPPPSTGFTCGACPVGYVGNGESCTDYDACENEPCFDGVTCTDELPPSTGFACGACPAGYEGDGETCTDIDACASDPCFAGVNCMDDAPPSLGYACEACPAGYEGDGETCTDFDACENDPCPMAGDTCFDDPAPSMGRVCCPAGTTQGSNNGCVPIACTGAYLCDTVAAAGTQLSIVADPGLTAANLSLGQAVDTGTSGPAFAWGAYECCQGVANNRYTAGVALPEVPTSQRMFGPIMVPQTNPPAMTEWQGILSVVDPQTNWTKVTQLATSTLNTRGPFDIPLSGSTSRASRPVLQRRGSGSGYLGFTASPNGSVVVMDDSYAEVSTNPISTQEILQPQLTPTCNDHQLATWVDGPSTYARTVRDDGTLPWPQTAVGAAPLAQMARPAPFDGRHVVLVAGNDVLELEADGSIVSRTTVAGAAGVAVAAFGTGEGLVVLRRFGVSGPPYGAPVQLIERETGKVLRDLGLVYLGNFSGNAVFDATVVLARSGTSTSLYFAATSLQARSRIYMLRVGCN